MATTTSAATPGRHKQAITGVTAPSLSEARIREAFPALPGVVGVAGLAKKLQQTYFLAPLGWLIAGPAFALKFAPFLCKRYTLTNKRLMLRRGWKPTPVKEIALSDIKEVRLVGEVDPFYVCATLEVLNKNGQVALTLPAVPEPEGFRQAVLNAVAAWTWQPGDQPTNAFVPANFKPEAPAK